MLFFARRKKYIKTNKKWQRLVETKTTRGRKRKAFGEEEEPTRLTFAAAEASLAHAASFSWGHSKKKKKTCKTRKQRDSLDYIKIFLLFAAFFFRFVLFYAFLLVR